MTFDAKERSKILDRAARLLVEEVRASAGGDLTEVIGLPVAAAAAQLALSVKTAERRLPITEVSDGKHVVTLANLRRYVAHTTRYPENWPDSMRFEPSPPPHPTPARSPAGVG